MKKNVNFQAHAAGKDSGLKGSAAGTLALGPETGAQCHEVSLHGCLAFISAISTRFPSADRHSPQDEKGDHRKPQLPSQFWERC